MLLNLLNFNPHHPCGWWRAEQDGLFMSYMISIHTTRVGGDVKKRNAQFVTLSFQSTPPVWVVTDFRRFKWLVRNLFQSTPPVWVVTFWYWIFVLFKSHFNPHHPCGWWHYVIEVILMSTKISIHTTRVGGDLILLVPALWLHRFQSTPPVWVVTIVTSFCSSNSFYFNPHHPCGWWRHCWQCHTCNNLYFNPHHPCGWWLFQFVVPLFLLNFNPHHPCGWWQYCKILCHKVKLFQSTPPVWVVTVFVNLHRSSMTDFNPHHPCGWWRVGSLIGIICNTISIHTTRVGGDQ